MDYTVKLASETANMYTDDDGPSTSGVTSRARVNRIPKNAGDADVHFFWG